MIIANDNYDDVTKLMGKYLIVSREIQETFWRKLEIYKI